VCVRMYVCVWWLARTQVEIAPLHQPVLNDKVRLHGVAKHEDSFYNTYSVDHKDVNVIAMLQQRHNRHRTVVQELETKLMQVCEGNLPASLYLFVLSCFCSSARWPTYTLP
jgi:hypothetical protein